MGMGETCRDTRKCFAAIEKRGYRMCSVLTETYFGNQCPFCKPERDVTDGKHYSYDVKYAGKVRSKNVQ